MQETSSLGLEEGESILREFADALVVVRRDESAWWIAFERLSYILSLSVFDPQLSQAERREQQLEKRRRNKPPRAVHQFEAPVPSLLVTNRRIIFTSKDGAKITNILPGASSVWRMQELKPVIFDLSFVELEAARQKRKLQSIIGDPDSAKRGSEYPRPMEITKLLSAQLGIARVPLWAFGATPLGKGGCTSTLVRVLFGGPIRQLLGMIAGVLLLVKVPKVGVICLLATTVPLAIFYFRTIRAWFRRGWERPPCVSVRSEEDIVWPVFEVDYPSKVGTSFMRTAGFLGKWTNKVVRGRLCWSIFLDDPALLAELCKLVTPSQGAEPASYPAPVSSRFSTPPEPVRTAPSPKSTEQALPLPARPVAATDRRLASSATPQADTTSRRIGFRWIEISAALGALIIIMWGARAMLRSRTKPHALAVNMEEVQKSTNPPAFSPSVSIDASIGSVAYLTSVVDVGPAAATNYSSDGYDLYSTAPKGSVTNTFFGDNGAFKAGQRVQKLPSYVAGVVVPPGVDTASVSGFSDYSMLNDPRGPDTQIRAGFEVTHAPTAGVSVPLVMINLSTKSAPPPVFYLGLLTNIHAGRPDDYPGTFTVQCGDRLASAHTGSNGDTADGRISVFFFSITGARAGDTITVGAAQSIRNPGGRLNPSVAGLLFTQLRVPSS